MTFDFSRLVPAEHGWMSEGEIAHMVLSILSIHGRTALEVGCFKGRTTSGLAQVAHVSVVDTFHASENNGKEHKAEFLENMRPFEGRVAYCQGDSRTVLPTLKEGFDLVLIDGDHDPETAYSDVREGWRLVRPGGFLYVDDINWDRVRTATVKALREFNPPTGFATLKLAYFRKAK